MTSAPLRCPVCSEPVPADAPEGLCPWCLYEGAATQPGVASVPDRIGGYPIHGLLGQGGFGIVYLAHHPALSRDVALKVLKQSFSDAAERARFQQEVGLLAQLDLPNVVRIFDSGVQDDHPYFTMPVMSGGTLRTRMNTPLDPWNAAALMAKIARAVHSLHTHPLRVLHRDLKPENILFDQHGTPYISDFGIAKVASQGSWTHSDAGLGCPAYVAPEQAFVDQGELTPATDVYSLGAIFYELLTGAPPHTGNTLDEVLRRIALEEPEPPRRIVPRLDRDLETVCLHALKRANARYPTAAQFAEDLENAAAHRPILARRSSPLDRTLRWVRRHPLPSAALVFTALLGVWVFVLMRSLSLAQTERLERLASTNAFTASAQAGAALFQLADYASQVRAAARDPAIGALVQNDGVREPAPPALERHVHGFDSLIVMDAEGRPRAHWRERPADYFQRSFAFRDYFTKARHLAEFCPEHAYLARAFRSEEDGKIKFGLSAPLLDGARAFAGVFVAIIQADSAFGAVVLQDPERDHFTSLLGPRDRDRLGPEAPSELTFLVHEDLADRAEYTLQEPSPRSLRQRFGSADDPCEQLKLRKVPPVTVLDYQDPVPGFGGRWLATIAPVGQTGFVVIVQTRQPDASADPASGELGGPEPGMAFRP